MKKHVQVILHTLSLIFLRKKTLTIIFITLAIPAMITTAYTLITTMLTEETEYLYKNLGTGENLLITTNTLQKNNNCTTFTLLYTETIFKNTTLTTPIIITDKETYIKYTKYWPRKALEKNKTTYVSIPSILKTYYDLKPGEEITICKENSCYEARIDLIHNGQGVFNSAIILVNKTNRVPDNISKKYCVYNTNNNQAREKIITPLVETLSMIQEETVILISLAYFPIMLLGLKKLKTHLQKEYRVLHEIGVSERTLRTNTVLILLILGGLISIYGVCLTTLIMHLSLWILRLYGIILVSRPLPDPATLFPYMVLFITIYFIATITVFGKSNGVRA